jgi:hypothetical protein
MEKVKLFKTIIVDLASPPPGMFLKLVGEQDTKENPFCWDPR